MKSLGAYEFVRYVEKALQKKNVVAHITDAEYVLLDDGTRVNGYFDELEPKLACACGKPLRIWLPTLVHEFSHFEQWKEKSAAWKLVDIGKRNTDASEEFFAWINGKRIPKAVVTDYARRTRLMEMDCERRTVKNIRKFGLPIDVELYCAKANAYIHFHNFMLQERKWYKVGREPYNLKPVYSAMNATLDKRTDRTPQKYMRLFEEHCL